MALLKEQSLYTLHRAKEEIDAIAKHVTAIAGHAISMDTTLEAKLEGFKKEIIDTIEARFAALEKTIMGEAPPTESSALADLDAKVSALIHGTANQPLHQEADTHPPSHAPLGDDPHSAPYDDHHHD